MRPLTVFRWRHTCAGFSASLFFVASAAFAQGGGQSRGTQAAPAPLSGRAAQGGSVVATQSPVPGATTSVNTINPVVQVQGPFTGSVRSTTRRPFSGLLSLQDAVQRGLEHNLGVVNLGHGVSRARGQRTVARSALLPNLVADLTATRQQINLAALGVRFNDPIPGFTFPTLVGPFNQFDIRARLSQSVIDLTAWNNYRASAATLRASELSVQDTRELVVLAVGAAYVQTLASRARVESGRAQLDTANAFYRQEAARQAVGLVAQLDVDRSQVQALTQQQRLLSLQNDFAKQKINLARMVGLSPTDQYNLADDVPFAPAPIATVDDALRQARAERADLKAIDAQVQAAERALSAARAERLPSVAVNADYGAIGGSPSEARRTFSVVGTLRVPLWQGGRADGQIEQAQAAVAERQAELDDLTSAVEADVRKAFLDVETATSQVDLAQKNVQMSRETLNLTRQRFEAGVTDNLEVIRGQEAVASAELDSINSVFAHNVAKLSLARAMGHAADRLQQFLKMP